MSIKVFCSFFFSVFANRFFLAFRRMKTGKTAAAKVFHFIIRSKLNSDDCGGKSQIETSFCSRESAN